MKHFFHGIILLCLLSLSPVLCRAERLPKVSQNFSTMSSGVSPALVCTSGYTVGTTDFVTYTCSGTDAQFGADLVYKTYIAINLPKNGSMVTTSSISELVEFQIFYYAENTPCTAKNIKVYVSEDGTWGDPLPDSNITCSASSITVDVPRGDYQVRIKNTTAKNFSIVQIDWYQDHCNCFKYVP